MKTDLFTTQEDLTNRDKYLKLFMIDSGKMKPGMSEEKLKKSNLELYNLYMNIPVPHQNPASKFLIIKANDSSLGYCKHCGEFIESNGASKGFPETHKKTCSTAYRHRELTKEREERRCDYCGELIGNHKGMRPTQRYHDSCYKKYVKHTLRYTNKGVDWTMEDMIADYKAGMSPQEIRDSGKYINPETGRSLSNHIIREKIRKAIGDEEMRSYEEGRELSQVKTNIRYKSVVDYDERANILKDFNNGYSISDLVVKYSVQNIVIYNIVGKPYSQSSQERKVQTLISSLGFDVDCNRRDLIINEIDLYVPKHKLGIEINGLFFHSSKYKESNYHFSKYMMCKEVGISLYQFTDLDVEKNWGFVTNAIKQKLLGISDKTKLVIGTIKDLEGLKIERLNFSFVVKDEHNQIVQIYLIKNLTAKLKDKFSFEIEAVFPNMNKIEEVIGNLYSMYQIDKLVLRANNFYSMDDEITKAGFVFYSYTNPSSTFTDGKSLFDKNETGKMFLFYDAGTSLWSYNR
jgi:hypothetical protein|nr:MAG TPA: endonuclease-like protein [Caudoviricetes sp.]